MHCSNTMTSSRPGWCSLSIHQVHLPEVHNVIVSGMHSQSGISSVQALVKNTMHMHVTDACVLPIIMGNKVRSFQPHKPLD
jgi:hypothetical protein